MVENLTDDQIAECQQAFALFDKDNDGKIGTREIGSIMRALGLNPSEEYIEEILKIVEMDEDGLIEFPAFMEMISKELQESNTEEQVRDAFRVFDSDGNGFISIDELRHLMTSLGDPLTEEEMKAMVKAAEVDPFGNVNYENFVTRMSKKM